MFQSTSANPPRLRIDSLDGLVSENTGEVKRGSWRRRGGVDAECSCCWNFCVAYMCRELHTPTVGDGYGFARGDIETSAVRYWAEFVTMVVVLAEPVMSAQVVAGSCD